MSDAPEETPEPDTESEEITGELKVAELPPQRRICLTAGEQSVEIIGPDDLETIAKLAASLWLITTPPQHVRLGFSAGEAIITERALPDQGEQDKRGQQA